MPEKIAILVSDLHLSDKPPIARSGEPDWYEAMARPLRELRDLRQSGIPVICGGDVFSKWKSLPKLINFAMRELPPMFESVMGQHDLPYHSWEERGSSAFWTLVEGGKLTLLGDWMGEPRLLRRGFHWGQELLGANEQERPCMKGRVELAVAHCYCWRRDVDRIPGLASEENRIGWRVRELSGYDVILFGDNHKGFLAKQGGITVFNAGTFMRRTIAEVDYKPMVGILYEDGSVKPHYLDTSRDVLNVSDAASEAETVMLRLDSFLEELRGLGEGGLDFRKAVETALDREQVSRAVRRVVLDAMESE